MKEGRESFVVVVVVGTNCSVLYIYLLFDIYMYSAVAGWRNDIALNMICLPATRAGLPAGVRAKSSAGLLYTFLSCLCCLLPLPRWKRACWCWRCCWGLRGFLPRRWSYPFLNPNHRCCSSSPHLLFSLSSVRRWRDRHDVRRRDAYITDFENIFCGIYLVQNLFGTCDA